MKFQKRMTEKDGKEEGKEGTGWMYNQANDIDKVKFGPWLWIRYHIGYQGLTVTICLMIRMRKVLDHGIKNSIKAEKRNRGHSLHFIQKENYEIM